MFTIVFLLCMLWVFGKLFVFGVRAAWGISKILLTVVLLPVVLIGMLAAGLFSLAVPVLLIIWVVSLVIARS